MNEAKKGPVVVSILNLKGGVGKTTVAAILARWAARHKKVLAVDLDPQANLSQALMGKKAYDRFYKNKEPSIVELFDGYIPPSSANPSPSSPEEKRFIQKAGRVEIIPSQFNFSDNLVRAVKNVNEKTLAKFISVHMADKDLVLIDCAPTESIFTQVAYHASRYIVVPVKLEFFAEIGLPLMMRSLEKFRNNNHMHTIDVCGILLNKPDSAGAAYNDEIEQARNEVRDKAEEYGWNIFDNEMTYSRGYPKIIRTGRANAQTNAYYEMLDWAVEILETVGLYQTHKEGQ